MNHSEGPTLAQTNHSELSHMAGAVDDSTVNIVVVIIIILLLPASPPVCLYSVIFFVVTAKRHYRYHGIIIKFSPTLQ